MSDKDVKRFSTSRISCFKQCPRKHHYIYVEQIEQPEDNIYTLSGRLFHKAMECQAKGLDINPVLKEWEQACTSGKLDCEPDLLAYIVKEYNNYYAKELAGEQVIDAESDFRDELEDEDYLVGSIDRIYTKNGYNFIRDYKTTFNPPKYTADDVRTNQQLLLYVPYAESKFNIKIDCIEIEEVRLAKLQEVPCKANGKPTIDKKQLGLVTYEAYLSTLQDQGLEGEKEYAPVLDWLEHRGHPLFNRVTCQLIEPNVIATNAEDVLQAYDCARKDPTYKVHGPLCNYCAYKELCELDSIRPDFQSRQAIIEKIKNN